MNISQFHSLDVVSALTPAVVNDDTEGTGTIVDLRGAEAALVVVHVGISGDTLSGSLKHDFKLQHADTDADGSDPETGDFVAVEADDVILADGLSLGAAGLIQTIDDAAEDPAVIKVAYVGDKPFIRILDDTTGTHTNGTPMSALVIKGHLRRSTGGAVPATTDS